MQHNTSLQHYRLAYGYQSSGSLDSALFYYKKALHTAIDPKTIAQLHTNASIIYKQLGRYEMALEQAFAALANYSSSSIDQASCLDNIGTIYFHIRDLNKSLEFHYKALKIRQDHGYEKGIAKSFNNIGNVYIEGQMYDSAIHNLQRALKIKKTIGEEKEIATVMHNMGWAYLEKEDLHSAEQYLIHAYTSKLRLKDSLALVYTSNLLSKLYLEKNNPELAWSYITQTRRLARKLGLLNLQVQSLENEALYYAAIKDFRNQALTLGQFIILNEILLNQEKARALAEMQTKYETDKKDQEITYLHKVESIQKEEIVHQKKMASIAIVAATFFLIMVICISYLLHTIRKSKNHIEQLNQEMQHRISNNLQLLSGVLKMQSSDLSATSEASDLIRITESRVNSMAIVHQKLFANKNKRTINLQEYLEELCLFLQHSFSPGEQLNIKTHVESIKVDVDQVLYIGLIVNELITNAIKYAFAETNKLPQIDITVRGQMTNLIFLEVRDNGTGYDPNQSSPSFGTKLIKTLTRQLKAESTNFNQNGAVYQLSIPLAYET